MQNHNLITTLWKKRSIATAMASLALSLPAIAGSTYSIERLNIESDADLKLYVIDCGTIQARNLKLFNPLEEKERTMDLAVPCYLIKHPSKGTLVWDAGLEDGISKDPEGQLAGNGAFHLKVDKTMLSQLQELGIEPEDVTYFAPSHLHMDHSGNANYFEKSTLLMQKVEYDVAFSEQAANYGFNPTYYSKLEKESYLGLNGDHDVFGDDSVIILSTPGHTPGHQSLLVKLKNTGTILLSGDLYHYQGNRDTYGIPVWNEKKATISSFARVDNILDNTPTKLWIQHDPAHAKGMRMSPNYYD
ncbi:N-acyl homoserine lactonase family protein [Vibrio profundi]|uniref:N-acyl homoserine lactonase family protein n=1 Tax=Vibrio profundi TaxID=1774960 RepID=UPI003734E8E3